MEFSEAVGRRRMVRNYLDRPVSEEKLERIMAAAARGPSAGFSQGQSFVVVRDPLTRGKIAQIAGEQGYVRRGFDPWLSSAPVHVICCTSEAAYHDRYREQDKLRSGGIERSWPVPFWHIDAGCCLMLLLLAAVDEGLGAGFLGLDAGPTQELAALLEIPDEILPVGIVTLGVPARDRPSSSLLRGRKGQASVVHFERWTG